MKPKTNNNTGDTLLALTMVLTEVFGKQAAKVLIATAAALAGYMGFPVHVRLRGNSLLQDIVGLFLEAGVPRVRYLTSTTEIGLLLQGQEKLGTLVYDGPLDKPFIRRIFGRLLLGQPIRHADAPGGEQLRLRKFDKPVSVIFLRDEVIADPAWLAVLVTMTINDDEETMHAATVESFKKLLKHPTRSTAFARQSRIIHEALGRIKWRRPIMSSGLDGVVAKKLGQADSTLFMVVMRLAKVLLLLRDDGRSRATPPELTIYDVQFIIHLLTLADVDDDQAPLSRWEIKTLVTGAKIPPRGDTGVKGVKIPGFTIHDLQEAEKELSKNDSTVHEYTNGLVSKGYLIKGPKRDRKLTFELTERGIAYAATEAGSVDRCIRIFGTTKPTATNDLTTLVKAYIERANFGTTGITSGTAPEVPDPGMIVTQGQITPTSETSNKGGC